MSDSDKVFKLAKVLEKAKHDNEANFYLIGEVLDIVNRDKLYKQYASHVTTFDQFLGEVGIKRAGAYHALRVWRKFGAYELNGISYARLIKLLPIPMDDSQKAEWVEKARDLPNMGFVDELLTAKGLPTRDECQHTERVVKTFCSCCGKLLHIEKSPD